MANYAALFLISILSLSSTARAVSLTDLYDNTRVRLARIHGANPDKISENVKAINEWLQGPASLQLTTLPSTTSGGTDEYEVGVFLPFRSPAGRAIDKQQAELASMSATVQEQRFSLLVSGLVREALWRRLLARAEYDGLIEKQTWLESLDTTMQGYFENGEIDRATYLRWQQEKLSHQLALIRANIALNNARRYYREVLGSDALPAKPTERAATDPTSQVQEHPELQLLMLGQLQLDLNYDLAEHSLAPWTLGVIARQLRGPAGNENLLGVSINIPITGSNTTSVNDYALWHDARIAIAAALAESYARLKLQLNEAQSDYDYFNEARQVLNQQVALGEEITTLYANQMQNLPKVYWLEQLLAQQDLRIEKAKMKVHSAEAAAKLNQIAGVTL